MNEEQIREIVRQEIINMLGDYSQIPLEVEKAFARRGFISASELSNGLIYVAGGEISAVSGTGVLYLTSGIPSAVAGGTKTVYAAPSAAGSPTNAVVVNNGIITSI